MEKFKRRSLNSCATKSLFLASLASTFVTIIFLWRFKSETNEEFFQPQIFLELDNVRASALRFSPRELIEDESYIAPPNSVIITSDGQDSYEIKDFDASVEIAGAGTSSDHNASEPLDSILKLSPLENLDIDMEPDLTTSFPVLEFQPFDTPSEETLDTYSSRLNTIGKYCTSHPEIGTRDHELKKPGTDPSFGALSRRNSWVWFSTPILSTLHSLQDLNEQQRQRKLNMQWCPVFKAASSPWMAVLMRIKHRLTARTERLIRQGSLTFVKLARLFHMSVNDIAVSASNDSLTDLSLLNPETNTENINLRLLIVRHPFERLLSAYRDKLERVNGRQFYHRQYGVPIIRRFRFHKTWEEAFTMPLIEMRQDPRFNTSEAEEANQDNIVYTDQVYGGSSTARANSQGRPRHRHWDLIPTFNEFVQYLLVTPPDSMDEHWRPVYVDCNACTHQFNLVLKVETMDTDKDYLLNELMGIRNSSAGGIDFKGLNIVWKRWANSISNPGSADSNSGEREQGPSSQTFTGRQADRNQKYFSQVSKQDLLKLYKLYEPDFLMFGYEKSLQEYLDVASG